MNNYIKIYSHPRSGTHFLEAFLAQNFYKGKSLSSDGAIHYGHWSNKILLETGEPYHQLFGSHFFPEDTAKSDKMIYIYRDGRAVIASIWNSGFVNKDWEGITFSEFLRKDIDWYGGLGQEKYPKIDIVTHWYNHVESWVNLQDPNLHIMRFEDLKNNPYQEYLKICKKFFPWAYFKNKYLIKTKLDPIKRKVGLHPNKATINSWESLFSKEDLAFFESKIPSSNYIYNE